jgi:hypothetical protein
MPKTLLAEDCECGGDPVQDALDVDVDHCLPLFEPQLIEQGDGANARIVDENIKLAVALARQSDEGDEVGAPGDVGAQKGRLAA